MIASSQVSSRYRALDRAARVAGATPHGLVAILYEELLVVLATMAKAGERGQGALFAAQKTQAITLCHALEAGLDHDRGGPLARELGAIYRAMRVRLGKPDIGGAALTELREGVASLATSWAKIAA